MRGWVVLVVVSGGCRLGFDSDVRDARPATADDSGLVDDAAAIDAAPIDGALPVDAAPLTCPGNYAPLGGSTSRYRAVDTSMTWLAAEQLCETDGHHLVVIDGATELALVAGVLPATNLWTGVTSRKAIGVFVRVTGGNATYLPWESGEPDATALECVQLDGDTTQMGDQDCTSGRRPVCECDGLPANPTTY